MTSKWQLELNGTCEQVWLVEGGLVPFHLLMGKLFDVVLTAPQLSPEQFAAECEAGRIRIGKSETMFVDG